MGVLDRDWYHKDRERKEKSNTSERFIPAQKSFLKKIHNKYKSIEYSIRRKYFSVDGETQDMTISLFKLISFILVIFWLLDLSTDAF